MELLETVRTLLEATPIWQQEAEKRLSTYQLRVPFIVYGYGNDKHVIIGKPVETHHDLWPRIGLFHVNDSFRGYYLTPLKALSWWDTPVPQHVKEKAVKAFEAQRKPVHDTNFPLFLMREALQLVNSGKKREVSGLVRGARKTMDDTAMWRQNIGLRHEDIHMNREALIEAVREFLESVSVRSRQQVAQDFFDKSVKGGTFADLQQNYPRVFKAVKKSVKDRKLAQGWRRTPPNYLFLPK